MKSSDHRACCNTRRQRMLWPDPLRLVMALKACLRPGPQWSKEKLRIQSRSPFARLTWKALFFFTSVRKRKRKREGAALAESLEGFTVAALVLLPQGSDTKGSAHPDDPCFHYNTQIRMSVLPLELNRGQAAQKKKKTCCLRSVSGACLYAWTDVRR